MIQVTVNYGSKTHCIHVHTRNVFSPLLKFWGTPPPFFFCGGPDLQDAPPPLDPARDFDVLILLIHQNNIISGSVNVESEDP